MTERIFITGDKHGSMRPIFGLAENQDISESDILMITGDAGYVWDKDYIFKTETLNQIFPGTIVFIDGNHENHDILSGLETVTWNGGAAHKAGERVYHLMRGEIYSVYGINIFTFGGARSTDQDRREEGSSWWREEEPSEEEVACGRKKLLENIENIDYVVTHESPLFAREFIPRFKEIDEDYVLPEVLDEWYGLISGRANFKKWYFGHMHADKLITPKLRVVNSDILLLGDEEPVIWS